LILLLGNEESSMNYRDNLYPFRQDSSFLYFFGIDQPGLAGVLDVDADQEILFGDDLTTEQIVWTGFREPLRETSDRVGVELVRNKLQLHVKLAEASARHQKIHYLPPYRPEQIDLLQSLLGLQAGAVQEMFSVDLIKAVVAQRSYKSAEEIAEITKAVNTTVDMQLYAITTAREGMTEMQVAANVQSIAVAAGGNLSFPTILTMRGEILHNGFSRAVLREPNTVLCDCGAETDRHYAGDLTRTFPVGKKFTDNQRDIYDIVYNAHMHAVSLLKPGIQFRDIHLHACEKLVEGLQRLGLMKGDIKESVALGAHALFFPCGLGHMLGLDIHDMENLGEKYVGYDDSIVKSTQFGLKSLRLGRALEAGFVITVEPGIYFNPALIDEWFAGKKFESFIIYERLKDFGNLGGVRIEEDFLITEKGSELLGRPLAKGATEIEELRQL
jgi:Xaa-Pro aminopeptidase